jgi:hypothetical protein
MIWLETGPIQCEIIGRQEKKKHCYSFASDGCRRSKEHEKKKEKNWRRRIHLEEWESSDHIVDTNGDSDKKEQNKIEKQN